MLIKDQSREINVDARILLGRLKTAKKGEVITYEELSGMIGRDVQGNARHILRAARRWAAKERVIFSAVTGEGVKRLDDEGKVRLGICSLDRIRRASRRAARTLTSIDDFESLSNESRIRHNMALSVFGVIQQATSRKLQDKISEKVNADENGQLAIKKSLELFA